jgi:hypothetical protein
MRDYKEEDRDGRKGWEILLSSAFRFLGNARIAKVRIKNDISRRKVTQIVILINLIINHSLMMTLSSNKLNKS